MAKEKWYDVGWEGAGKGPLKQWWRIKGEKKKYYSFEELKAAREGGGAKEPEKKPEIKKKAPVQNVQQKKEDPVKSIEDARQRSKRRIAEIEEAKRKVKSQGDMSKQSMASQKKKNKIGPTHRGGKKDRFTESELVKYGRMDVPEHLLNKGSRYEIEQWIAKYKKNK